MNRILSYRPYLTTICRILVSLILFVSCDNESREYHIGVSQCSEDSWRTKLKAELEQATYFNEDVRLSMYSADDDIDEQRRQIRQLISQRVDLLIVSPQQTGNLTDAITEARQAGIPVILFDRKSGASNYTAFMGADNYLIGRMLGEYAAGQLGGKGNIIAIAGQQGSSPAIERDKGFCDAISKYPDMHIIGYAQGDWKQPSGEQAITHILDSLRAGSHQVSIDCVFGGNDRMVVGARLGIEKYVQCHPDARISAPASILYLGVDALPTPGGGIEKVRDGVITASAIYPTHGDEVIQLALNILKGNPYDKETIMETSLVTQSNANVLLMQYKEVERQSNYIKRMHTRIDTVLKIMNMQRVIMFGVILLTIILAVFFVITIRINRARRRLNSQLSQKNDELSQQKEMVERQRDEIEEQRDKLLDALSPAEESVDKPDAKPGVRNQFVERFLQCVDRQIADSNLTIESISDEMGVSRVQLYRKIKTATGHTPIEIIRQERLRRAKTLLTDLSLSISEVAYRVGFSAPSYFAKCYKEYYGKSPSDKT